MFLRALIGLVAFWMFSCLYTPDRSTPAVRVPPPRHVNVASFHVPLGVLTPVSDLAAAMAMATANDTDLVFVHGAWSAHTSAKLVAGFRAVGYSVLPPAHHALKPMSSGTLVASRHHVKNHSFTTYTQSHLFDTFAHLGVVQCDLTFPSQPVRVVGTALLRPHGGLLGQLHTLQRILAEHPNFIANGYFGTQVVAELHSLRGYGSQCRAGHQAQQNAPRITWAVGWSMKACREVCDYARRVCVQLSSWKMSPDLVNAAPSSGA
jgi:hypothetical protein